MPSWPASAAELAVWVVFRVTAAVSGVIVGGKPYTKEATVYACIDHNARPPKLDVPNVPSCATTPITTANVLQDSTVATVMSSKQHHPAREVVTVRTPLISTQESCV